MAAERFQNFVVRQRTRDKFAEINFTHLASSMPDVIIIILALVSRVTDGGKKKVDTETEAP